MIVTSKKNLAAKLCLFLGLFILLIRPPLFSSPNPNKDKITRHNDTISNVVQKGSQGVDISHFQGKVNFALLKQNNIHFVYLKATDGMTYLDPSYHQHVKSLGQEYLPNGAYHFFEPNDDPIKQAEFFISQVKASNHTLPPMLDVEISKGMPADKIKSAVQQWLKHVESNLGCSPIIYSYGDYWSDLLGPEFNNYLFWLADYAAKESIPQGLKNLHIWQYSEKGQINGIEHSVDRDKLIENLNLCHHST